MTAADCAKEARSQTISFDQMAYKRSFLVEADYLEDLREAILKLHGCEAEHFVTVGVTETFEGDAVWRGEVEVFRLNGHLEATLAYAWTALSSQNDLQRDRHVVVLEVHPINSPQSAVRAEVTREFAEAKFVSGETTGVRNPQAGR